MEKETNDYRLKDDFLAAYHSILFSRTSDNDADVERRRLAVKYMTAIKFESEDTAAILLGQGLKQYEKLIEKTGLLKESNCPENKDRTKWRSSLKNARQALSLVKPLPCQKESCDKVCGRRDLVDRDVENLFKISEMEVESSTIRKKPAVQPGRVTPQVFSRMEQDPFSRPRYDRLNDSPIQPHPGRVTPQVYSRTEQDPFSRPRYDRLDDPTIRKSSRSEWETIEDENKKKYESRRSGFSHENDHTSRISSKNHWERMEDQENTRKYDQASKSGFYRSAREELHVQQQQQKRSGKKTLGGKGSNSKFVCPFQRDKEREEREAEGTRKESIESEQDERLKGIDEKLIELVRNEIMDSGTFVSWDDVAGLEHAKKIIKEIVVLPMLRPDIFTGLRRPPKGILLFGPPGTGKTLIGKCIASQSKSTFFSISASSLTSKWIGEGEKMVRALFAVARVHQPSVIFIDEIDSLLTQRSETEHESSRRIKTEFLVQLDGAATGEEDRILVIGATNRPQELDEAARRRFVKRLYVPLPEFEARRQIVVNLLSAERHELDAHDIENIAKLSEHYSGADMTNLCKEASMGPIRSIPFDLLENIRKEDVRCVTAQDFNEALSYVRPSVSQADLGLYVNWDRTYGSGTSTIPKNSE